MNASDPGFRRRIGRIETLIAEMEQFEDPAVQARTREIVQALLEFHAAALANVLSTIAAGGAPGRAILDAIARDELAASILLLHDLHPDDLATRVAQALDRVRPQLHSHGGDVELLGIEDGAVRLKLKGSCHGCPSSAATLRQTIEAAIYEAAPDVSAVNVDTADEVALMSLPIVTIGSMPMGRMGESA